MAAAATSSLPFIPLVIQTQTTATIREKEERRCCGKEVLQDWKQSLRQDNRATMRAKSSELERSSNEPHKKKESRDSQGPSHVGEEINK